MSAAQFAAQAEITSHPSHHYLQLTDDRDMKKGLRNHLEECREKFQMPYEIRGREAVKMLHSDFVTEELEKYPVNKLLETNPPVHPEKVDEMEKSLGRADRSLISQLRSNYCPLLRDYQHRIGKITTDLCRKCNAER